MSLPDEKKPQPSPMRTMAEVELARHPVAESAMRPAAELLHELQVHQVELEMQNEALRQKQIELVEARDRYVGLYEFAPVGYLTLTPDGMIEEVNLTAVRLLGVERKDLLHRPFASLVVFADQDRWLTRFLAVMKQDGESGIELAMQQGDGTVFQALLDFVRRKVGAGSLCAAGNPLPGQVTVLHIALTDISELKRSHALNEALLKAIPFPMDIVDAQGRILYANGAMERVLGRPAAGGRCWTMYRDDQTQCQGCPLRQSLQVGEAATLESSDIFGGRVFEIQHTGMIYEGQEALMEIFLDVTERKQAEAELRATRNRLQATLDALPDLLFEVGADGRIHDYHTHRSDLLAVPPDIFLGKTFAEVLPLEAAEACLAAVLEATNKGWSVGRQFILPLPQGEHWFELSVAPMAATAGQDRRYVLLSRDVTERKRIEARLAERDSELRAVMKEAHDRLAEFAAGQDRAVEAERKRLARELHDELGQGLTALHLDIEWLSKKLASVTPEIEDRFGAMRQMIAITGDSMRKICEDMRPGVLDDLGLEAALEDHAQKFFLKSGIPCSWSMDRSDFGVSDPASTALFRIFQEALTNIQRHAEASAVTATLEDSGDAVILTIADDGKGLPENAEAGDRFGLRGMRERTRLLNGTFAIDSARGQGTRIEVRIPGSNGARAS